MKNGKKAYYSDWSLKSIKQYSELKTIKYIKDLELDENTKVLDVGGWGNRGLSSSLYFINKKCKLDILNIDDSIIEECNQFNIQPIIADIFTYKLEKKYDVIVLDLMVEIHHRIVMGGLLDKLLKQLEEGGCVLIHLTDETKDFNQKIPHWKKRMIESSESINNFKSKFCNGLSIEEVMKNKYNAEYLGLDTTRKFLKYFKIK